MKNINLFFPIEIIKRELDYKIILACMVLEKNQCAVIGQHDRIEKFMLNSFKGVYIGKNVMNKPDRFNDKYAIFNKVKNNNKISVIHIDEEGGIYAGVDQRIRDVLDARLDVNVLHLDDIVCTWGDFQTEHYKKKLKKNNGPKIISTGHIKFEFTKNKYFGIYNFAKNVYQKKYGRYILIDTHFTFANNAYGIDDTFTLRHGYGPSLEEKIEVTGFWADEQIKIAYFVVLAKKLAHKFSNLNIIFRSHPNEDISYYKKLFRTIDNVIVEDEGEVVPWILGAECLIHDHCTTSVEAYLMNIPVINYIVKDSNEYDSIVTSKIGTKCRNEEEIFHCIDRILKGDKTYKNVNSLGENELALLDNLKNEITNDLILLIKNVIKKMNDEHIVGISTLRFFFIEFIYSIFLSIKKPIRKLFFKQKQKEYEADLVAFPGFKREEINTKLEIISKKFNQKYNLKFLSSRAFIIEKK